MYDRDKKLDRETKEWHIPRRGILKSAALVTGAFLAAVLRLDDTFGQAQSSDEIPTTRSHRCCSLCLAHDGDCVESRCKTSLSWICLSGSLFIGASSVILLTFTL